MKKSDRFFNVSMMCFAALVLLLEGYAVYYVASTSGIFEIVLVLVGIVMGDTFALGLWFLE